MRGGRGPTPPKWPGGIVADADDGGAVVGGPRAVAVRIVGSGADTHRLGSRYTAKIIGGRGLLEKERTRWIHDLARMEVIRM